MIYFNCRKWQKVDGGYEPIDGQKLAVNFISDILMRRYLINGAAREVVIPKVYTPNKQLELWEISV